MHIHKKQNTITFKGINITIDLLTKLSHTFYVIEAGQTTGQEILGDHQVKQEVMQGDWWASSKMLEGLVTHASHTAILSWGELCVCV